MRLSFLGFSVWLGFAVLLCVLTGRCRLAQAQAPEVDFQKVDYQSQVKALLRERCFACHGPLRQESNLRLDTLEGMLQGGDSGSVLSPGEPDKSRILERVRSTDSSRMPPEHEGEQLKADQIELLSRWIAQGAQGVANEQPEPDPRKHWAFQSLVRPPLPQLEHAPAHPIDAFLHKLHSERGIVPQTRAPNDVLLRRLSIDLIGLPPAPEDWEQLPKEWDSMWYESTVDKFLDDPRHGQRWARHWMDVWRFSDWWGLGDQLRNSQLHMWHWRDWIIEALNTDRPYDEMVRLMLAADEIAPENFEDLRATGFLARNYFLFNRNQWMDETTTSTIRFVRSITTACGRFLNLITFVSML
jgi:mono/diheme cytochrome c family protein